MVVSRAAFHNAADSLRLPPAPPPARSPRLWRDLVALAGGQLVSKLLGFAAFAYLARMLAPAAYGAVEYAAGLALLAALVVDAGLSPLGVRRIAREPRLAEEVSAELLGARSRLGVVAALALAGGAVWLAPDAQTSRLVALFAVGLVFHPWSQMWLFQAVDRIGWTALVQTVRMGTFLAVVALAVREPGRALWAGVAEIAGLLAAGVAALALQRRFVAPVRFDVGFRRMRELLAAGLPIALAELVVVGTVFAPLVVSVNLLGTGAAAPFAAAHRLFFALLSFSWIYHFNLFPVLARGDAPRDPTLRPLVASSLRLVGWAGAAGALALSLVAAPLLALLFGPPFASAAGAFALLVWALPLTLLADHAGWLLLAHGGERAAFAVRSGGLAVAVAAGVPLVGARGPAGGALALLVATLVLWLALHHAARRRLGWMPWTPALPPLAAALALLVALRALALPPLAAAALGLAALAALAAPFARTLAADFRRLADAKARSSQVGYPPPTAGEEQPVSAALPPTDPARRDPP